MRKHKNCSWISLDTEDYVVVKNGRERERNRQTETDRQTDRQTDR